jgi:predicted transcriptional regulator
MTDREQARIDHLAEAISAYRAALIKHGIADELADTLTRDWQAGFLAIVRDGKIMPAPLPLPHLPYVEHVIETKC